MRLFLLACCCVCFISCSGTENSPPVLQLELDGVDPEASRIIQLNYEQAKTGEDWFELAQYLHAHGLSSNAIKAYEYSLQIRSSSQARYLLALSLARQGAYEKAIQHAKQISGYGPAVWRQGYWYLDLGNPEQALQQFNKALAAKNNDVAAIIGKSRAYLALGNPEQTIKTLQLLLDRGGKHPYVFYLLGKAYQQSGQSELALQLLRQKSNGPPELSDIWYDTMKAHQSGFAAELNRAISCIDKGNLQEALQTLRSIERTYPYSPDVQSNLATVQLQLNKPNDAINTLGNAIRKSPEYAPLHLTMAFTMSRVNAMDEAMQSAKKALSLQPSMVVASTFIGKLATQQKDYAVALSSFKYSLQLGDSDPRTRELYAEMFLRVNDWAKAQEQYELVLQISPTRTGSIGGLCIALTKQGNRTTAITVLQKALRQYPDDPNLLRAQSAIGSAIK